MGSLFEWITDWIKEGLIDAITGQYTSIFNSVNNQVADVANQVGQTPQGWNGGVFSMIQNLSETVVIPIAGMILTFVLVYELIQMILEKNNMHEFDTFNIFKWIFKTFVATYLLTNCFTIVMAVFDVAQNVVSQSAGVINGNLDVQAALSDLKTQLEAMGMWELIGLWLETNIINLCMWVLSIVIFVIVYGRMIEIYLTVSLAPIPFSTMANREWGQMGTGYLRSLFALGFQGFLILICVAIYAVLVQSIPSSGDVHGAIWGTAGYTVLLLAVRLLCATTQANRFEAVTAMLDCQGYTFTAKGKTILQSGWKEVERIHRMSIRQSETEHRENEDAALPVLKEGQTFETVSASLREGKTSPPKHYTEDTLLSAMETAGAEDMPDDAERKGLGTPATRAATLEKLVSAGFVQRKKKQLISTEKGRNLIAVLPDNIKSPILTAEWESMLKQVEHGELSATSFMDQIADMSRTLVKEHTAPEKRFADLFPSSRETAHEAVGVCPRCGAPVYEGKKGFFCDNRECSFALWKDNRFFSSKKKSITKSVAAALLKEGRISMSGLYSEKTGKTYDAEVILDDTGGKYVNFKLEFPVKKGRRK